MCCRGFCLVRAASRTAAMATTARHSGSIRAKEGVTDGGEAPSEDGGVVIIMTGQRQTFGKSVTV